MQAFNGAHALYAAGGDETHLRTSRTAIGARIRIAKLGVIVSADEFTRQSFQISLASYEKLSNQCALIPKT